MYKGTNTNKYLVNTINLIVENKGEEEYTQELSERSKIHKDSLRNKLEYYS